MPRPMTTTEKILARAADLDDVSPGQMITARVDCVYTMDITGRAAFTLLKSLGARRVFDRRKVVVVFDHFMPPTDPHYANLQNDIRKLAREFEVTLYDIGAHGNMHHVVGEEGYLHPGTVAVGTDAHALTGGALGAVVTGVGATDAAIAMALGRLWLRVPPSVRLELTGTFPAGTMARDAMAHCLKVKGWDGTAAAWGYHALEITGDAVAGMSMDSRYSLCNLASDTGAKNAIIPPDHITAEYLTGRSRAPVQGLQGDPDAVYSEEFRLDVSSLEPQVACPHSPDNVQGVSHLLGKRIDVATIAPCTNGRLEDLHIAARILRGRKIHPEVRMVVSPISQKVYAEALEDGTFGILAQAGAVIGHSTCGPCLGAQLVVLGDGEVCIGTVPKNLQGRMGSPTAEIYSANPAVVAASALKGAIADPREYLEPERPARRRPQPGGSTREG